MWVAIVDNSKRLESIDTLMVIILGASFVVVTIGQSFRLDTRLVWAPTICFFIWGVVSAYYKPKIAYSDSPERSVVERIRGWSYVTSLAITLLLNSIIVFLSLSKYSSYVPFVIIAVMVSVSLLLAISNVGLIMLVFRKELKCMNPNTQKPTVLAMVTETGAASIWFSLSILFLDFNLAIPKNQSLPAAIVILILASLLFAYGYTKHRKSSEIADTLSLSLIDSKWNKKYNATIPRRMRRPRRRNS